MRSTIKLLFLLGPPACCAAAEASPVRPQLEQFCSRCHSAAVQTAGINLEKLITQQPLVRNSETWRRVIEVLESGKMPPAGQPQPSESQRRSILQSLDQAINHFDYSQIDDPGFAPLRRLTHTQYDNTVRDLFGVDLKPAARFTAELTGSSGFDNSANTLFLQPALMERYIAAAERVVAATTDHRRTRELIFIAKPGGTVSEPQAAEKIVKRFLLRAFRRPPTAAESNRAMQQFRSARGSGQTFDQSIQRVLAATLISPKFLFRIEAGGDNAQPHRVSDWELASRLSYFMWASMPDDELFDQAARNRLHEPRILAQQVRRMLADPKADTLGTVFAAQWLGFQHIGSRIMMDPIDHPWCTASLMDAMRAESSMFFLSLLRDNQPIRRLIDADYTFVNQELASTLYGMKDVLGAGMRRVSIADPNRGGILGQGSILAVTSNYNQTSPVKRGFWILDTVLGTPPPPPPANAGVFKEEVQSKKDLTFREKLALHSSDESCRGCHSKMDPIGFSLENFDYFGRWRDNYARRPKHGEPVDKEYPGKTIDTSGTLPDGTILSGPAGLKRALVDRRHDDLVRQTVSKMLAYSLGRQLEYYDEPAVRKIIVTLKDDDYHFQTLLQSIVESYPFQYRKNPSEEPNQ